MGCEQFTVGTERIGFAPVVTVSVWQAVELLGKHWCVRDGSEMLFQRLATWLGLVPEGAVLIEMS
jgi:hypothetical protein